MRWCSSAEPLAKARLGCLLLAMSACGGPSTEASTASAPVSDRPTETAPVVPAEPPVENVGERNRLVASDATHNDYFGHSVAIERDVLVVGAPTADGSGQDAGAVYVYRWRGRGWVEEQRIVSEDVAPHDHFGSSVALHDGLLAVGAPHRDDVERSAGAVYLFTRRDSGFRQRAKLVARDAGRHHQLGLAVATHGGVVVAGAPHGERSTGAAYVIGRAGADWRIERLDNPDAAEGARFGKVVAVGDGLILVGAPRDGRGGPGVVHVYRPHGEGWRRSEAVSSPGATDDAFGGAIAIADDTVVIGAPQLDSGSLRDAGAAYLYRDGRTALVRGQELRAPTPAEHELFGISVAARGDLVAVGSFAAVGELSRAGTVRLYAARPAPYERLDELLPPEPGEGGGQFGMSIALGPRVLVVGADQQRPTATYAFELVPD